MQLRSLRLLLSAVPLTLAALPVLAQSAPPAASSPAASPSAQTGAAPTSRPAEAASAPPANATAVQTPPPSAADQAGREASSEAQFDLARALISPDRGFSADEAGRRASERSPQIAVAQANSEVAAWDAKAQRSNFLPTIQGSATYRRISYLSNQLFPTEMLPPPFDMLGQGGDLTQPLNNYALAASARIPVSDLFLRILPSYQGALRIADARAIEVAAKRAAVDLQAREAFYGYARALATQLVAEQALRQAEAQASQAKLFVDAGTAAPVDFMTARARVESMRGALERSKGIVAVARDRLATLTGAQSGEVEAIREPVTDLPSAPEDSLEQLLSRARDQRPELRALRKLVEASDRLRTGERNAALPTVSLDGNVLHAQPNPRKFPPNTDEFVTTWEVGATLAWSPNSAVVGYQRTQRAKAELARARADLASLEEGVRMEVVQAYEDYKAADAAARASEAQQRAAEETYRVRSATYRVGAGVQIDLLNADFSLTQARLDFVNAVIDARIALARLRRAVGG